jgi:hypothetical protein
LVTRRLVPRNWPEQDAPMMRAASIRYEVAERARGIVAGGVGAMLKLAQRVGLVRAIDRKVELLKAHVPYHESDHVLNIALNVLAGGRCLEDIELLRQDEGYLNALGAQRIPDPTTAGDFCRRFAERDVEVNRQATAPTLHPYRLRYLGPPSFGARHSMFWKWSVASTSQGSTMTHVRQCTQLLKFTWMGPEASGAGLSS